MKFVSLTMENWRSFYGVHAVEFSMDSDRPLTLLLGPNGAGKTAFLNAFTWCLYGNFTRGFKRSNSLINLDALSENEDAIARVELKFVHHDDHYSVCRTVNVKNQESKYGTEVIKKNGRNAYADDIHRILPPLLSEVFFFDSETFSSASILGDAGPSLSDGFEVKKAIKSLLSGDIYDNAIADLTESGKSDILRLPRKTSNEGLRQAELDYSDAQARRSQLVERQSVLPQIMADARADVNVAKVAAERFDPERIKQWQEELGVIENNVAESNSLVTECDELFTNLSRGLFVHFSSKAVDVSILRLDKAEKAGLIPPRIHETVLEKALDDGVCAICNSELGQESLEKIRYLLRQVAKTNVAVEALEARNRLRELRKQSVTSRQEFAEQLTELCGRLSVTQPAENADFTQLVGTLRTCRDTARGQKRNAELAREEFHEENSENGSPTGEKPTDALLRKQKKLYDLEQEFANIEERLASLNEEENAALSKLRDKARANARHRVLTSAMHLLSSAKMYFEKAAEGLMVFGRKDLEQAINAVYSDLVKKPFQIQVRNDFRISVVQRQGGSEISVSQSESVLALIAFLGAIARLAPKYEEIAAAKKQFNQVGKVKTSSSEGFPVVLDAPTSPFDGEYEEEVARSLPNLLPQVIVPVSAKSISVWESVAEKIGAAYVLEVTSSESTDRPVQWRGRNYRYSIQDRDIQTARTRIVRLSES